VTRPATGTGSGGRSPLCRCRHKRRRDRRPGMAGEGAGCRAVSAIEPSTESPTAVDPHWRLGPEKPRAPAGGRTTNFCVCQSVGGSGDNQSAPAIRFWETWSPRCPSRRQVPSYIAGRPRALALGPGESVQPQRRQQRELGALRLQNRGPRWASVAPPLTHHGYRWCAYWRHTCFPYLPDGSRRSNQQMGHGNGGAAVHRGGEPRRSGVHGRPVVEQQWSGTAGATTKIDSSDPAVADAGTPHQTSLQAPPHGTA